MEKSKEAENKKNEKHLQDKFVEFQVIQQQMKQVQKHLEQINEQKSEIENVQQSLTDISSAEIGREILVPVCSGIFAKAKLVESKELLVNVGNNVVVKKNVQQVKEMLSKQGLESKKVEEHLLLHLEKLAARAAEIEKELDSLIKEANDNV